MIKSILYPLIGAALVTITPFLLTFEKGQDIIRGLFGYEIFVLLLCFVYAKDKLAERRSPVLQVVLCTLCVGAMLAVAYIDLINLLKIKGWTIGWYGVLPVATVAVAVIMQKPVARLRLHQVSAVCFMALFMHIGCMNYFFQPMMVFPLMDYAARSGVVEVDRMNIAEDFRGKYLVTDSVTITKEYLDTSRSNVVILVESWGVPLELACFESQLTVFQGLPQTVGIHNRMYSRTRTAEREDLISEIHRDTGRDSSGYTGYKKDTVFLPQVLNRQGFATTFMYGGDSLIQYRNKYIYNVGFVNTVFGEACGKNRENCFIADKIIAVRIDSLLSQAEKSQVELPLVGTSRPKQFIAWTTSDSRFPMNIDAGSLEDVYFERLEGTLQLVADLVKKHPEVRFIVQGDHNPILSPLKFQEKFYKRWVPFVVLN